VRVGCLAQIVNVIAPLVTSATGVLRQSIYYPYAWALQHARGRVLDPLVDCDGYEIHAQGLRPDFARDDVVPYVDLVATYDAPGGQACLFVLNRDLQSERELSVECRDFTPSRVTASETLTGDDLKASNSFERPKLVAPRPLEPPRAGSTLTLRLPPRSYSVVLLATA